MQLSIVTGRANPALAEAIASFLGVRLVSCTVKDFPDGEVQVEVHDDVRGHDLFVIQPTSPPVSSHLLELLLLADACRRRGTLRLTAVIPYFGYARQDRRLHGTEPVGARLVADLLCTRFDRILTVDLHNPAIEGFFSSHLKHLSAVALLSDALRGSISPRSTIVAPDLGAVKLAQRYAELLGLPVAYIQKVRLSGSQVSVRSIVGEVEGRSPILIDDMISTAGTMASAIEALLNHGCLPQVTIAATHALFVGDAEKRLSNPALQRIVVTDTILSPSLALPLEIVSVGRMIADTILHMYEASA